MVLILQAVLYNNRTLGFYFDVRLLVGPTIPVSTEL